MKILPGIKKIRYQYFDNGIKKTPLDPRGVFYARFKNQVYA